MPTILIDMSRKCTHPNSSGAQVRPRAGGTTSRCFLCVFPVVYTVSVCSRCVTNGTHIYSSSSKELSSKSRSLGLLPGVSFCFPHRTILWGCVCIRIASFVQDPRGIRLVSSLILCTSTRALSLNTGTFGGCGVTEHELPSH